ncbi:MAG: arginine--tRNA ligase, partial [Candidatus Liptonbacteria bacterium]|nr:arginine--tRNA ligase [Candidatus Liptonbacteria bacterium]
GKLVVAYRLWRDQIAALYKTKNIAPDTVTMLQDLYVMFHDQAKRHPELEQRAQEEFRKLEEGDEENRKLWKFFCDESLKEFGKSYETLGVQFDTYRGESAYENDLKPLVASLLKQRIAVESEGAVIINLDKFNLPPALVRKSDGASLYLTRDIANLQYRIKKHHPARIIYVVGNEQALHFEQLFAIARLMKLNEAELTHVKYGLVLDENHKKLSTREGRVIPLGDVVEKAIALARAIANKNEGLSEEERETVARTIAIGALKYNDLAQGRLADIAFNWDRMLALRGDSAPYLQYTYARFRNIARKGKSPLKFWARTRADAAQLTDERELRVLRELLYFPHIVRDAADAYEPHHVANYLHRLADALNALYEAVPILKAPADARASRLALVEASTIVLKNGLGLLGIGVVEKM